jgi:hypothetical protein
MREGLPQLVKTTLDCESSILREAVRISRGGSPPQEDITRLGKAIASATAGGEWAGDRYRDLLARGVYSPAQLLLYSCCTRRGAGADEDFPFLFGTVGLFIDVIVQASLPERTSVNVPRTGRDRRGYWRMLQATFRLRELREEGEPLSIEIQLPVGPGRDDSLPVKKLAQVFGRGVGLAGGIGLKLRANGAGGVRHLFRDHDGTPSAQLYQLAPTYQFFLKPGASLMLRRDGVVILAVAGNPLVEFYDGGWHVVDILSAKLAVEAALDEHFGEGHAASAGIAEPLLRLAYHMGSHWHGGILAVVDIRELSKGKLLEPQKPWSRKVTKSMRSRPRLDDDDGSMDLSKVEHTRLGRVFLTNAIQDGATLFNENGRFHSSGRVIARLGRADGRTSLGTGNRAAMALSRYGVALKVSRDGGIRLYSRPKGVRKLKFEGLRIR